MTNRLGPLAKDAREGRNYSQADVARLLGLDDSRLSRIENGHQSLSLKDYMSFAILFATEFSIKTGDIFEDLKAEIYARLCDLLEDEDANNPRSFKRQSNLNALKADLEMLHG